MIIQKKEASERPGHLVDFCRLKFVPAPVVVYYGDCRVPQNDLFDEEAGDAYLEQRRNILDESTAEENQNDSVREYCADQPAY